MPTKLMIEERIQAIEVELATLRKSLESMPSGTAVDIDGVKSKIIEIVENVCKHASGTKRAYDRFSN